MAVSLDEECLRFNIPILRVLGLWPPQHRPAAPASRLYPLLTAFVYFNIMVIVLLLFGGTFDVSNYGSMTMTMISECCFQFISGTVFAVKINALVWNARRVQRIKETLDSDFGVETEAERDVLRACGRHERKVTTAFCSVTHTVVVLFNIGAILKFIRAHMAGVPSYRMPIPYMVVPSNLSEYLTTYTHLLLTITVAGQVTSSTDCVLWTFMHTMCGHFDILTNRLREVKLPRDTDKLKVIIRRHIRLIRLKDDIQLIFRPVLVIQFSLTSVMICVSLFQITYERSSVAVLLRNIMYLIMKMGQLYMHCYYGQKLIDKSEEVGKALYSSTEWYRQPTKESKALTQLVLMRTQKPLNLTVIGVLQVSHAAFKTVLDSSISYFIFLKTINSYQ